ncbi:hypothetical protein [Ferviditalea candida]|uniref:Uncharacterized protein n=1 Tax=Ferviditalea candida TaxID=3108399 RepID=A0ABU5ZGJ3_9BACL|nr:hypothetical protein [Paenibacillaceae bacterium T2]
MTVLGFDEQSVSWLLSVFFHGRSLYLSFAAVLLLSCKLQCAVKKHMAVGGSKSHGRQKPPRPI